MKSLLTPRGPRTPGWETTLALTCALAVLLVGLQLPALVAGTLDGEFVLLTALAALQVFRTEALDLAGFVIDAQLHPQRTGADHALSWGHGAVVTTATIVQRAQV